MDVAGSENEESLAPSSRSEMDVAGSETQRIECASLRIGCFNSSQFNDPNAIKHDHWLGLVAVMASMDVIIIIGVDTGTSDWREKVRGLGHLLACYTGEKYAPDWKILGSDSTNSTFSTKTHVAFARSTVSVANSASIDAFGCCPVDVASVSLKVTNSGFEGHSFFITSVQVMPPDKQSDVIRKAQVKAMIGMYSETIADKFEMSSLDRESQTHVLVGDWGVHPGLVDVPYLQWSKPLICPEKAVSDEFFDDFVVSSEARSKFDVAAERLELFMNPAGMVEHPDSACQSHRPFIMRISQKPIVDSTGGVEKLSSDVEALNIT